MRTHIGNWLKLLPPAQPPGPLVHRVQAAQRAALARRARHRAWWQAGGLAIAAGAVMAVALAVLMPASTPEPPAVRKSLEYQAEELEQLLAHFDTNDRVLDMQTAGTIVQLEDRIAAINYGLRNETIDQQARVQLMEQRIDLMQALAALHMTRTPELVF